MLKRALKIVDRLVSPATKPSIPPDAFSVASPSEVLEAIENGAQFDLARDGDTTVGGYWYKGKFFVTYVEKDGKRSKSAKVIGLIRAARPLS